jgi:hypothetical protein
MHYCLTAQQLAGNIDVDDYDNNLGNHHLAAILYEIAPGASFLSQQQISNVMRVAAQHLRKGKNSDLTITVQKEGQVSFQIESLGCL